ncbi:MAG: hypothetical protein GY792_19775 [Gammaproteobacteria bacterium]|nr:hypothetical protein [Gammaproteobacteria bacterium]
MFLRIDPETEPEMIHPEKNGALKRRIFVSLLITFIAAVAGMGVLWVQSLPKITVIEGKISVVNCELPLPTYAIGSCPKLHCKKLILESGLFPQYISIGFSNPKPSTDQVLAGAVRFRENDSENWTTKPFECELDGREAKEIRFL